MAHIILVHGRNANSDSWGGLTAHLAGSGHGAPKHEVSAPTMNGHNVLFPGVQPTNAGEILYKIGVAELKAGEFDHITIDTYLDQIEALLPDDGSKAVLIGHSMGGAIISLAASRFADRIDRLIYIAAMLPDDTKDFGTPGEPGYVEKLDSIDSIEDAIKTLPVDPMAIGQEFLDAGSAATGALTTQPRKPRAAPFKRDAAFDALPKTFILTGNDPVIPKELQQHMTDGQSNIIVKPLAARHLPQFLNQAELFPLIDAALA